MAGDYSGFLAVAGLCALALSHYVAKHLPPPKPRIIGIDLGTTYSCVGVFHAGNGSVEILADAAGKRTIPSVVAFTDNGTILVGHAAKAQATANPGNTVYETKRFMGKDMSAVTEGLRQRFPFTIVEGAGSTPSSLVRPKDSEDRVLLPEEVGGIVIGELKRTAEARVGKTIHQAVMSVPAEFTQAQRNATIRAGNLAGLEVLRVLSEPTAAAMAYGMHERTGQHFIIVFDFGGGTLDVSLLRAFNGQFSTYAIAGNRHLGGEDLSHTLFLHALDRYAEQQGAPLTDPHARQQLRSAVDQAKLALSTATTHTIALQLGTVSFNLRLTRDEFEEVNARTFRKIMAPVHCVLRDAELHKSQIHEVVLVGGSTRIPKVRAMLHEYFGKAPSHSIDPDEAVAVGVAMQAGILGGAWPLNVSVLEMVFDGQRSVNCDLEEGL